MTAGTPYLNLGSWLQLLNVCDTLGEQTTLLKHFEKMILNTFHTVEMAFAVRPATSFFMGREVTICQCDADNASYPNLEHNAVNVSLQCCKPYWCTTLVIER